MARALAIAYRRRQVTMSNSPIMGFAVPQLQWRSGRRDG